MGGRPLRGQRGGAAPAARVGGGARRGVCRRRSGRGLRTRFHQGTRGPRRHRLFTPLWTTPPPTFRPGTPAFARPAPKLPSWRFRFLRSKRRCRSSTWPRRTPTNPGTATSSSPWAIRAWRPACLRRGSATAGRSPAIASRRARCPRRVSCAISAFGASRPTRRFTASSATRSSTRDRQSCTTPASLRSA